jgi:hypothetical protein
MPKEVAILKSIKVSKEEEKFRERHSVGKINTKITFLPVSCGLVSRDAFKFSSEQSYSQHFFYWLLAVLRSWIKDAFQSFCQNFV